MVTITRINLSRCLFSATKDSEIEFCKESLRVYVDGCFFSKLYKEGKWDGYHKFFDTKNYFDYGLQDELCYHLNEEGIKFEIKTNYVEFKLKIDIDERMRYYQNESIKKFYKNSVGIIKVPPRGGKTFIASEMFRISSLIYLNEKEKFLFVVDTEDLFKQAVNDISEYLQISKEEIGMINSRKQIFKKINVAMIQTMVSTFYGRAKNKDKIKKLNLFLLNLNFLAVDEVHEHSSVKRINVFKKCKKLKNLCAFSGTPFKQFTEIQNLTIKGFFGGIIFDIPKQELQKEGFLTMDKVFLMHIDHKKSTEFAPCESYNEFLSHYIHDNNYRNAVLCEIINVCMKNKWKTLVLFNSVIHGKIIRDEMDLPFISGSDKGEVRDEAKSNFLKGKGKVLLASNIFKKGITLPEAQILIIADGGLEGSNITQKYSRVLGTSEGKSSSAVIDLMDTGVKHFKEHSLNRLEIYDLEMEGRVEVYNDFEISTMSESINEWLTTSK